MEDNFWKGKRVLVTGPCGFLGAWLVMLLLRKGAYVVGIIRDQTSQSNLRLSGLDKYIDIVTGTICNYRTVERALNDYNIEIVFHLAAQAIVSVATRLPITTFINNIDGTLNLLEAARQLNCVKRIVIASSDKVYGDQEVPYTEKSPMLSQYPYDVSKRVCELVTNSYRKTYFKDGDPKFVGTTRCANLFGGGDLNFTRIIPRQILRALRGENLSYNVCMRQFLYVLDAVQAYLSLAEKLNRKLVDGEAFNFGTGKGISMKDLVHKHILRVCRNGKKLNAYQLFYSPDGKSVVEAQNNQKPEGYLEYPQWEIRKQFMSCEKAFQLLGWKPVYSLQEGIEDTYAWYESWFGNKDMVEVNEKLLDKFIKRQKQVRSPHVAPILETVSTVRTVKSKQGESQLALKEL